MFGIIMEKIAVIVPGIMGSSLMQQGQALWTDNIWDNYNRLSANPGLLAWTPGSPATATNIIEQFTLNPLPIQFCTYKSLLDALRQHHEYGINNRTYVFSYDWRQSIEDAALGLGTSISRTYNIPADNSQRQDPSSNYRFNMIGHSMGALIARIAIYNHYIHPANVESLIQIGAPLEGAACAFRPLYDEGRGALPGLELFYSRYAFLWRKRKAVMRALAETLRRTPGMCDLLPPQHQNYVWVRNPGQMINPLNDNVLDPTLKNDANNLHSQLAQSISMLSRENVRVETIYCTYFRKVTDQTYDAEKVTDQSGSLTYRVNGIRDSTNTGDGTVLETSATFSNCDVGVRRPVVGTKHAYMCCKRNVIQLIMSII